MSEVADRESLRARRPSPDLTSMRGCLHRLSSSTDGGVDAGSRAGAGAAQPNKQRARKLQGVGLLGSSSAPPGAPGAPSAAPLDPDPRSPSRRAPIVHSPRAAEQRRGPSARSLAKHPSCAAACRPLADSPLGGSAATGRPAPGGPARSALRPPPWPSPSLLPSPNGLRQRSSINRKGKRKAVGYGRDLKSYFTQRSSSTPSTHGSGVGLEALEREEVVLQTQVESTDDVAVPMPVEDVEGQAGGGVNSSREQTQDKDASDQEMVKMMTSLVMRPLQELALSNGRIPT
ncbi:translation initiation factor IF-2-like [Panicum virgatum]|uniref:translation initiation factor IF-2-like n=1 Tax=Panicum virgatum TaxID=38727 RepID=UPI0019D5C291|nr:translation initiation factor IF-2-like [Panicum virgatum]